MAQKVIRVTSSNVETLSSRFFEQGTGVPIAIGYYLLASFGDDGDYDMLSAANFNAQFETGSQLRNGFFEAVPKP